MKILKSFLYAMNGIALSGRERNMRVHLGISIGVLLLGILFQISPLEWIIVFFCFGLVLCAEAFNTAIETIINLIRDDCKIPYENKSLGMAKEMAAGAVLITAVSCAFVGLIVFFPYFLELFLSL